MEQGKREVDSGLVTARGTKSGRGLLGLREVACDLIGVHVVEIDGSALRVEAPSTC